MLSQLNMKKKILFLIPNLAHGGAERVLVNLANNLDSQKYDVTVQTLFDVGVNRQYLQPQVRYIPGWKKMFRGNSYVQLLFTPHFLYRRLIRESYDIVIAYLEGTTSRIVSGCNNPDIKTVAWIHTGMIRPSLASRCFRSLKEAQKCYSRINQMVMVSSDVQKQFSKQFPGIESCVLYNTNETGQIIQKAALPVTDACFNKESFTVCTVGKLISLKGFDRLLTVHKRLLDEGLHHTVYILGIGEEEEKLRQKIREYGVEDSFVLLGFRDNPYQYVSRCDLYVCSSRREGFSTAVTEALIVGTPVVSTDCSGARELLGENNEYGIVVENSEDGIYGGMKKMLSEPETLAHYRRMAGERGKCFSKEKTVQAVEEMLDNL